MQEPPARAPQRDLLGDRFEIICGVDDLMLENVLFGAVGWVSGLTNTFPRESVEMFRLAKAGKTAEALELYRWFMPLLHLDADHDLVQSIKLAEQIMGRGSERVRMPRMPLAGARRADVIARVERCAATRVKSKPEAPAEFAARRQG